MSIKKQEQGFVSIIMALVIMTLVTLIALGFAFLARQNQEETQNRQLSTQAFYAAESGVNDSIKYITDYIKANGVSPANKTTCGGAPLPASTIGSTNAEVKYTCVLFDTTPESLDKTVTTNSSWVARIQADGGKDIKSITITWQNLSGNASFATNATNQLSQAASGNTGGNNFAAPTSTGILRATIIPANNLNRPDLTSKSQTLFLYPRASGSTTPTNQAYLPSTAYSDPNQGTFVEANCNAAPVPNQKFCKATVTGLGSLGTDVIYLRLRSIYQSSNVTVTADTTDNVSAKFVNEQAKIDATGKADNVLRRIQVRVPLRSESTYPEFAVETIDSLCKRLVLTPTTGSVAPLPSGTTPAACVP